METLVEPNSLYVYYNINRLLVKGIIGITAKRYKRDKAYHNIRDSVGKYVKE